jgi:hypothetical protein
MPAPIAELYQQHRLMIWQAVTALASAYGSGPLLDNAELEIEVREFRRLRSIAKEREPDVPCDSNFVRLLDQLLFLEQRICALECAELDGNDLLLRLRDVVRRLDATR